MTPSCKAWVNFLDELLATFADGGRPSPATAPAPSLPAVGPATEKIAKAANAVAATHHGRLRESAHDHPLVLRSSPTPRFPGQKSLQEIGFRAHHGQPIVYLLCPVGLQMACLTARFSARRRRRPGCSWRCGRGPTPRTRSAWPSPGSPGPDPAPTRQAG